MFLDLFVVILFLALPALLAAAAIRSLQVAFRRIPAHTPFEALQWIPVVDLPTGMPTVPRKRPVTDPIVPPFGVWNQDYLDDVGEPVTFYANFRDGREEWATKRQPVRCQLTSYGWTVIDRAQWEGYVGQATDISFYEDEEQSRNPVFSLRSKGPVQLDHWTQLDFRGMGESRTDRSSRYRAEGFEHTVGGRKLLGRSFVA